MAKAPMNTKLIPQHKRLAMGKPVNGKTSSGPTTPA